jgi:vitamin B12 transporter
MYNRLTYQAPNDSRSQPPLALRMACSLFSLVSFLVPSVLAAPQDSPPPVAPRIPPVQTVITVSAEPVATNAVPGTVTVVTREYIENAHANDFADLLRKIPNLYLSQTGGRGGLATLTLRGGKPNFTMVMVDSVPINDIANILGGSVDFSAISPDNIERIEIVSGPLSSVYGSEAVSGVVNIISRKGEGSRRFDVEGEFGNFASRLSRISLGGSSKDSSYSLDGSYLAMGNQMEGDHYSLGSIALAGAHGLGHEKTLQFSLRVNDKQARGFPPNGGGPEFSILPDLKFEHARDAIFGSSFVHQVKPWWLYRIDGNLFLRIERSSTPAILDSMPPSRHSIPSQGTHEEFFRPRLYLSNVFTINRHLFADLNAGFKYERGNNDSILNGTIPDKFQLDRSTLTLSGGLLFQSGRVTLTGNVGFSKTAEFQNVSPRAGISYRLGDGWAKLRASWGTGFSLPSFEAIGDPLVGNRKLKPEYSQGFDAGMDTALKTRDVHFSVTYYRNTLRDLIDFSPQQFRLVNRSSAITQGVEWSASFSPIRQIKVTGQLTFLDARLLGTTEHLRDLPRWRGGFGVQWRVSSRLWTGFEALAVSRRYDFQLPIPDRETVPAYTTASFVTSYQATQRLSLYVRVDNLCNSHFQEFLGFPNGGLYGRIGFKYQLLKPTQ